MIEWKIYDPDSPPKLNVSYLIWTGGLALVAELEQEDGELIWVDTQERMNVHVKYYAEINYPNQ